MIGALAGSILQKKPNQVLIDVGGIGYEVEISMNTYTALPNVGEKVKICTHLLIREDAHILFGFYEEAERIAFRQLIKVNGLGPKIALSVLSTYTISQLANAFNSKDSFMLTRVPGIGSKTAERLLIELKDKFPTSITNIDDSNNNLGQIREALLGLGYKDSEIKKNLQTLPADISLEDGLRTMLKNFSI